MQQMWDLFVERRYFKFQSEIQFSSNSIMKQLKQRDSEAFVMWSQYELLLPSLHHITTPRAQVVYQIWSNSILVYNLGLGSSLPRNNF